MQRTGIAVLVTLAVLSPVGWLAGCGGETVTSETSPAPERTPPPEATPKHDGVQELAWSALDCTESPVGPGTKDEGRLLLPEPPMDGLPVVGAGTWHPDMPATLVVYGEADCEDPTVGRLLGAHVEPGEDGLNEGLPCGGKGFSEITLHGVRGLSGRVGDTHWVCWMDPEDPNYVAPTEFAVFGRGIPAEDVIRAARAAERTGEPGAPNYGGENTLTVPAEARPPGLQELARGAFSLRVGLEVPFAGRRISWNNAGEHRYVSLVVGRANAKDALLSRVAVVALGGRPVKVREAVGLRAQDRGYDGYVEQFLTWQEGDRLVYVESGGLSRSELEEFVGRLAPASEADVEKLSDSLLDYPVRDLLEPGQQLAVIFRQKDCVVVVSVDLDDELASGDLYLITAEDGPDYLGSAPGPNDIDDPEDGVAMILAEYYDLEEAVRIGYVVERVARVELEAADGTVKRLPLKESLTPDNGRYFLVYEDSDDERWKTITAYDAEGRVLQSERI